MHLEFLVEEPSIEKFLNIILPKILIETISFNIHPYRGKQDLLSKLPQRLKGYNSWIDESYKIIILVDEDREDCKELKQKMENIATQAGLITKSSKENQGFQVVNRILVEELEAWFFGDINAICQAYPKVSSYLGSKAKYRDPDAIQGGTWEALEKILQEKGYHQGGLEKNKAAKAISQYMNPKQNNSRSFQVFYQGLLELINFDSL